MQAFLIHRTTMRSEAKIFLSSLEKTNSLLVEVNILKKSYGKKWKQQAESKIIASEVVVVYDSEACADSENTLWEIDRAKQLGKPVVSLSRNDITSRRIDALQSAYDFSDEFDSCFEDQSDDPIQLLELYKIMVMSSEQLIQRRQITNGFFITVIGAIVGATGLIVKEKVLTGSTIIALVFPLLIGLLMCRSWKNLIENYGKLNAGKFQVIHRIEHLLGARIFAAEWIALGKGQRDGKYKSFTSTEQNVPRLFSYLLWSAMILLFLVADWDPMVSSVDVGWSAIVQIISDTPQHIQSFFQGPPNVLEK